MGWLTRLRARIKYRNFDDELREELEVHRALKEAELRRQGASPADARVAAIRAMGNMTLAREDARGVWFAPSFESLWQDSRYALRTLRKSPGFTATAILTLGLGIGLNVSVFSMFNGLALRGWDVRDPSGVVVPFARPVGNRGFANWMTYGEYAHLRDHTRTLEHVVARAQGSGRVFQSDGTDYSRPYDYVQFQAVTANFFSALGIDIVRGRGFLPGEDAVGVAAPVAVVTHGFWQHQLGADPAVVGRTLRIGVRNVAVTVVGVTRQGFSGVERLRPAALFVPLPLARQIDPDGTDGRWDPLEETVMVAGRLKSGVSLEAAEAELDTLSRQYRASIRVEGNGLVLTGTRPIGQPGQTDRFMPTIAGFGAAVLLVLLLACANVGNLQLARALARQRELAVRLSLGAARVRLIRQLLTEAAYIALLAAVLGFVIAWFVPELVLRLADDADDAFRFVPDTTVLGFALLLAIVTAVLFALAPALRATRTDTLVALRARTDIDRGGRRLRSVLLACQVALSLTLLTSASLLTRGVLHAQQVEFGFDASRIGAARIGVPTELYKRSVLTALWQDLDERVRTSGIGRIARTNVEPLNDSPFVADVRTPDQAATWNVRARERQLSASGFSLVGLDFVSGVPYSDRIEDRQAVINESLARQLWPGDDPVGRTVIADDERYTITGIVRDTYYTTPAEITPVFHKAPEITASQILFRSDRAESAAELQGILKSLQPGLRVTITPVMANIEAATRQRRFAAGLTWAVGLLGLGLAIVGVFGVFAYAVEERRREIGLRLALGARTRDIFRALFDVNRWSLGGGVAVGLLLSIAAGFLLRGYLFGLSPLDPLSYLVVSGVVAVAAVMATAVPARRALRVDPALTLKAD